MTKKLNIKRIAVFLIVVFTFSYVNLTTTAFAAAATMPPETIAYVESDNRFVSLDGADPEAIAGRFVQTSVENGYIWIFSKVNNRNVDSAIKMLDKELDVSDKKIKNVDDVDQVVLQQASNYLQSTQFSVLRVELEEKSHESGDQKWQRYLGYAAGVAAIVSLFKK